MWRWRGRVLDAHGVRVGWGLHVRASWRVWPSLPGTGVAGFCGCPQPRRLRGASPRQKRRVRGRCPAVGAVVRSHRASRPRPRDARTWPDFSSRPGTGRRPAWSSAVNQVSASRPCSRRSSPDAGEALVLRTQGLEVEAPLAFAALHRLLLPVMRLREEPPRPAGPGAAGRVRRGGRPLDRAVPGGGRDAVDADRGRRGEHRAVRRRGRALARLRDRGRAAVLRAPARCGPRAHGVLGPRRGSDTVPPGRHRRAPAGRARPGCCPGAPRPTPGRGAGAGGHRTAHRGERRQPAGAAGATRPSSAPASSAGPRRCRRSCTSPPASSRPSSTAAGCCRRRCSRCCCSRPPTTPASSPSYAAQHRASAWTSRLSRPPWPPGSSSPRRSR